MKRTKIAALIAGAFALVGVLSGCSDSYGEYGTPPPNVIKYESPYSEWSDGGLAIWCDGADRVFYAASGGTSVFVVPNHPRCAPSSMGPVIR